jgi:hypothetical protein
MAALAGDEPPSLPETLHPPPPYGAQEVRAMFGIAALLMILAVCGVVVVLLALVGLLFKVVFRIALLPLMLAAGVIKVLALVLAGVAGVVALAVVGPVLLVAAVVALPLLALGGLAWAGFRLIEPI